jgi:hypothetical protein
MALDKFDTVNAACYANAPVTLTLPFEIVPRNFSAVMWTVVLDSDS